MLAQPRKTFTVCVARVTNAGMLHVQALIFEYGYPVVTYVTKLNEMKHLLTLAALLVSTLALGQQMPATQMRMETTLLASMTRWACSVSMTRL